MEYLKICKSRKQSICSSVNGKDSWLLKTLKYFHIMFAKTIWLLTQFLGQSFLLIFIQEPSSTTIHFIPSLRCSEEKELVGVPNHSN